MCYTVNRGHDGSYHRVYETAAETTTITADRRRPDCFSFYGNIAYLCIWPTILVGERP